MCIRDRQETGGSDVAERGGDRRQRAESLDRRFEDQVYGVETRRSRHAEDGQAPNQESDGDAGNAVEESAEAVEGQRQVLLAHDHQQHGTGQRQPLQRRQQRIAGLRCLVHLVHRITTKVAVSYTHLDVYKRQLCDPVCVTLCVL